MKHPARLTYLSLAKSVCKLACFAAVVVHFQFGLPAQTNPIFVTIDSNPPNLAFKVDNVSFVGHISLTWAPGSAHTLDASSAQVSNGNGYVWSSWSDGQPAVHTVTAPSMPPSMPLNYTANFASTGPDTANSDTIPPTLTSLTVPSTSIDVRSAPQTFPVLVGVADDLSGFSFGTVTFLSPSGAQFQYSNFSPSTPQRTLTGLFTAMIPIPQFSETGVWTISQLELVDQVGNRNTYSTSVLTSLSLPTTVNVISNPDTTPPQASGLSFQPPVLNVSAADQVFTISLHLVDSGSGIDAQGASCQCGYASLSLRSPSGIQPVAIPGYKFTLVSGTLQDGIWQAQAIMPRFSEAGVWTVEYVSFRDFANNSLYISDSPSLQAAGLAATLTVNAAPTDILPPQVTGFSFVPLVINTSQSAQQVSFTFNATDNLSGTNFGVDANGYFGTAFYATSPSGSQSQYGSFSQIAGTPQNGQWQGTITFPQYSEAGTWNTSLSLRDKAGNTVSLSAAALRSLFTGRLNIIRPSQLVDGTVTPTSGGTVQDQTFRAAAQVTVPPNAVPQTATVAIDVFSSPLDLPIPQGFVAPGTRYVNIEIVPHPVGLLPPPGLTVTLPLISSMPAGTVLVLYRVDPATGNLVAAASVTPGSNVIGRVNADTLSAMFTGIASLSTVVGLTPNSVVLGDVNLDGQVDCQDVAIVKAAFGKRVGQPGFDSRADTNNDGVINITDLSFVTRRLSPGTKCP